MDVVDNGWGGHPAEFKFYDWKSAKDNGIEELCGIGYTYVLYVHPEAMCCMYNLACCMYVSRICAECTSLCAVCAS